MSIRLNGVDKESTIHGMSADPHGTYILADNPNIYEIQRSNNFELVITGVDNLLKAGADGSNASDYIGNVQEVLRLSVSEMFVPHFTQSFIEIKRGNNSIKFAGALNSWDGGSLSFIDYIGAETKEALMAWQNCSYDIRTEKVGLVTDYKKEAYLTEYTPDYQEVRTWVLHGCWLSKVSEDGYSSEGNDKKKVSVEMQYDRAELLRNYDISNSGVG